MKEPKDQPAKPAAPAAATPQTTPATVDENVNRDFRGQGPAQATYDPNIPPDYTQKMDPNAGPDLSQGPQNAERQSYREVAAQLDGKKADRKTLEAAAAKAGIKSFLRLGEALAAAGKPEAAGVCFEIAAEPAAGATSYDRLEALRANLQLGRFEPAFKLADQSMEAAASPTNLKLLTTQFSVGSWEAPPSAELVEKLAKFEREHPDNLWPVALRVDALESLYRIDEALEASKPLAKAPKKYGWMRFQRGHLLLQHRRAYEEAKAEFKAALESKAALWHAGAFLAEIDLIQGKTDAAFAGFDALIPTLFGYEKPQALTWRGLLRLWLGDAQKALPDFEAGVQAAAPFALGWRGAAKLLLGKTNEALADLDAYLAANSDREALVWRGEARRLAGRDKEALADLDAALEYRIFDFPALLNRALVKGKLKDEAGMLADYEAIPAGVRAFAEKKAGLPGPAKDAADVKKACEAGLKAMRGVRRPDAYLFPIWLDAR